MSILQLFRLTKDLAVPHSVKKMLRSSSKKYIYNYIDHEDHEDHEDYKTVKKYPAQHQKNLANISTQVLEQYKKQSFLYNFFDALRGKDLSSNSHSQELLKQMEHNKKSIQYTKSYVKKAKQDYIKQKISKIYEVMHKVFMYQPLEFHEEVNNDDRDYALGYYGIVLDDTQADAHDPVLYDKIQSGLQEMLVNKPDFLMKSMDELFFINKLYGTLDWKIHADRELLRRFSIKELLAKQSQYHSVESIDNIWKCYFQPYDEVIQGYQDEYYRENESMLPSYL